MSDTNNILLTDRFIRKVNDNANSKKCFYVRQNIYKCGNKFIYVPTVNGRFGSSDRIIYLQLYFHIL